MRHAKELPKLTPDLLERFWVRVWKTEYCWGWGGYYIGPRPALDVVSKKDYRVVVMAHRLSCLIHHGLPPDNQPDALHSCDNKGCVNPDHLRWGSNGDNRRDWFERGDRSNFLQNIPKGSQNGQSKLTESKVIEIRRLLSIGILQKDIVEEFGIDQAVISRIKHRRIWRHI